MTRQPHPSLALKPLNGAASQAERLQGAPAPERFQVDGRSLPQLLAFGAGYGAEIRFYGLDNMPHGDWSAFFSSDPAIAAARHASLDLPALERELRRLLADIRRGLDRRRHGPSLKRLVGLMIELMWVLDRLPRHGGEPDHGDPAAELSRLLAGAGRQDSLAQPLKSLSRHLGGHPMEAWVGPDWHRGRHEWLHALLTILEELAVSLIEELRHRTRDARADVTHALSSLGHAPQSALYNAFVALFMEARQEMNRIPRRLLAFYQTAILKQDSRAASPDQLFLTFTLAKGIDQASVPRGTLFSAGTDSSGQAINYAVQSSLAVTPATVTALDIHRVTFGSDRHSDRDQVPTGVITGIVEGGADGVFPAQPFPLFGSDGVLTDGSLTMTPASLGFLVESPTLMLCGGLRTITVTLHPSHLGPEGNDDGTDGNDGATPMPEGTGLGNGPDGTSAEETGAESASGDASEDREPRLSASDRLAQAAGAARQAFILYYSTAGGWMAVDSYAVATDGGPNPSITLSFQLPADAPPLVAVTTKAATNAPTPTLPASAFPDAGDQPTLLAKLRYTPSTSGSSGDSSFFEILSLLRIAAVSLDVSVTGLPPDSLSTPSGTIDTRQNFAVFGMAPAQGAALKITAPELFVKQLGSLSLTVEWAGLPVTSTGFCGYYKNYVVNADGVVSATPLFDNTTFRASLTVATQGYWSLADAGPLYLFQTQGTTTAADGGGPQADAPVLASSTLAAAQVSAATPPPYYDPGQNALFLTLAQPPYAFGNVLYASNLAAASSASVSSLQAGSRESSTTTAHAATAQIAQAAAINAGTSDDTFGDDVSQAIGKAVSALNSHALTLLQQAITAAAEEVLDPGGLEAELLEAISLPAAGLLKRLWTKLTGGDGTAEIGAVTGKLKSWLAAHEGTLAKGGAPQLLQAGGALAAADSLAAALKGVAGKSAAGSRPTLAAALEKAQGTLKQSAGAKAVSAPNSNLPNQPWQPMASAVSLSYQASGQAQLTSFSGDSTATGGADPTPTGRLGHQYRHLGLFDAVEPAIAARDGDVHLLPQISHKASLYIDLSAPVPAVSLLFILQAGPDGWSTETPDIAWQQRIGGRWRPVKVLGDTTNSLLNTGIVTLQLDTTAQAGATPQIRVLLYSGMDNIPYVKTVTTNAVSAVWVGPGGATQLGTPLPAGTITQSVSPIAGIGGTDQPEDSVGGYPQAVGKDFDLWMAERLRHKGFAIECWDYARLVLAAFPSLWQIAVVPAVDGGLGVPAPGHVWVVAVAGPKTPNVADTTEPLASPEVLAEIGELLAPLASPFATITVTNPPYLRLTVVADLVFEDTDTIPAYEEKLNSDLVAWLSPWPDASLGPRPPEYYSRQAIADFISQRAYVREVLALEIRPESDPSAERWYYLTSAARHLLHGTVPATPETAAGGRRRRHDGHRDARPEAIRAGHDAAAGGES